MLDYISTMDAAAKWGLTMRRVAVLCKQGRVPGAKMIGGTWIIPADVEKLPDARIKSGKYIKKPKETAINSSIEMGGVTE